MKSPEDYKGKVALSLLSNATDLVAAGPITLQPGSMAYRVVIANHFGKFVVFNQQFPVDGQVEDLAIACMGHPCDFHNGNYFNATELPQAMICFAERIMRNAEHVKSIYRED